MCNHNPVHCILPPHILDHMSESDDPHLRKSARDNIEFSAQIRTLRDVVPPVRMASIFSLPAGKIDRRIYDMNNQPVYRHLPGTPVRSEGQPVSKDQAVNEAYDHSKTVYDFYFQLFKRHSLDNQGMPLVSSVHAGTNLNNAFWTGQQMVFGDGDGVVLSKLTHAIDVIGHEFTHGVITNECNLDYHSESGALNEHFADVFGSVIKQWKSGQGVIQANWLIGEDVIVPANTRRALRDMLNPGTAFKNDLHLGNDPQPSHYNDLFTGSQDNGGVHINSGIPNRVFALTANAIGGNSWDKAGPIWYKALLALHKFSTFKDAKSTTIAIAGTDYGEAEQKIVSDAWDSVGV